MTTHDTNPTTPTSPRPFGFWLRVIDHRLDEAMRELFAAEGITRRDWRRLNLIAGTVTDPRVSERLAARPERVAPLVERGWVEGERGAWRLTETGEAALASLHERVSSLRTKVAGAVSPEDFATTLASLEAIARELGWSEDERMPRRRGFGRRHSGEGGHHGERTVHRHHGEGFGPCHHGESFGPSQHGERGHGADCDERDHRGHHGRRGRERAHSGDRHGAARPGPADER